MESQELTTRSWLDSPSWRWEQALAYIKDEQDGIVPVPPSDPLVQLLCRVARAWPTKEGRAIVREFWEPLYGAIYMGTFGKDSSVTAQTDALILHGFEPEAEEVATLPISELTYALYASIFFDVKGMTDAHAWLQDQAIECVASGDPNKAKRLRARLLAMVGTVEDTTDITVIGKGTRSAVDLMRRLTSKEHVKKTFDYIMSKSALDAREQALVREDTVSEWERREYQESQQQQQAGSDLPSLTELTDGMENSVRMYRKDEPTDKHGVDFNNKYISVLIGKKNEN